MYFQDNEEKIDLKNERLADGKSLKDNIRDIDDNIIDWILCKTKLELMKYNQMGVSQFHIDPEILIPARFWGQDNGVVTLMKKSYAMISSVRDFINSLYSDMQRWRLSIEK